MLTLAWQNSVTESHAPDADITLFGMEVWGNLTLRGAETLTSTGSQCGIHVSQALVVNGCTVDARADGADITDETVAGVIAGGMAVRGGGRALTACTCRTRVLARARPAAGFPSTPRGSIRAQCPSIHYLLLAAHRELTTQNTGLHDESID